MLILVMKDVRERNRGMAENSQKKKVYNFVIEQIKGNRWMPGEKIYTEKELCEKLDVSRIAVREALGQCAALGILEKRKGAGTYISKINISSVLENIVPLMSIRVPELMDVLRFRLYFEPGNTVEFLKSCTEEDIEELEDTYRRMLANSTERDAFYSADYEFHALLARGTGNPVVISISNMLTGVLMSSQRMTNLKIGPEVGLKYHKEILTAIRDRDAEMAALLMTRHIEATIQHVEAANTAAIARAEADTVAN